MSYVTLTLVLRWTTFEFWVEFELDFNFNFLS
jgi:hypothetical protein